jgi:hypothetical protein
MVLLVNIMMLVACEDCSTNEGKLSDPEESIIEVRCVIRIALSPKHHLPSSRAKGLGQILTSKSSTSDLTGRLGLGTRSPCVIVGID